MAETATTARRWNSFVCPGCRFVFRVPQDHDGQGVVCPGCKIMLRLPAPGEDPGPLVVQKAAPEAVVEEEDDHDHEDHDHSGHHEEEEGGVGRLILMMAVPGVLLLGLFGWMMMPKKTDPAPVGAATTPQAVVETADEKPIKPAASDSVLMEETAKNFLEASTWEEALRWVVRPEQIRPRMEAWYAAQPYKAPGFKGTSGEASVLKGGETDLTGLNVRTGNFEERQLALVKTSEGYRADWESWVGWSEMSWEDFKKQRPTEAKLFRVICSPKGYYNFGFKDEKEWTAFRLDSPDKEDFIYGYAPVSSGLAAKLRPLDGVEERMVILKLKFPPDAPADNQVIIEDIVGSGWLELPGNP